MNLTRLSIVFTIAIVVLRFSSSRVCAQETAAQRHEMATNQVKKLAADISARCLTDIRTLDDWKQRRSELRRQLFEMLGLDPLPPRTPLKTQITGRLERAEYRIEKVVFQSLPGLYVTGDFFVPKTFSKPLPTILYLCGHSPHPLGAKFNYQDRAIWFATHGYACLILDTLEFGEVAGIHHGTHDLNMWHWLSLGYTPAGTEVWNAIRALDYLETRPEVDPRRIGLTGISGGGAITWYTAAVDDRVAAAAPVCSTFTWGSQAEHWIASGQCDCIYYHNTYQWDFPIVGALIAPRPLLMISGQMDTIFPPDGYHAVFQRTKRIYDLFADANSDRIREVDDKVGHSDPPHFLREARQWMQRWLKDDPSPLPIETNAPPKETAEDLACLTNLPADAINFKIQDLLTAPATWRALRNPNPFRSNRYGEAPSLPSQIANRKSQMEPSLLTSAASAGTRSMEQPSSRSAWDRRRSELIGELKEKVFRWFPTESIPFETKVSRNTGGWAARYADYKEVSFQTEDGVRVRAQLLWPKGRRAESPLLIYVKRRDDSIHFMDIDELLPLFGRRTVLILNPRFTEHSMSAGEFTSIERTAVWSGRTVAAMQVWDIARAVRWAIDEEKLSASGLSVYGKGEMGINALYAAVFEERIQKVILNDPPASHWQRPALLNVLRVTDIAEAAAAFAPRRLVSVTKLPETFDFTRAVYSLQKASGQFGETGSLPEAVQVWK